MGYAKNKTETITDGKTEGKIHYSAGSLMSLYKKEREIADRDLYAKVHKHWNELEPEGCTILPYLVFF